MSAKVSVFYSKFNKTFPKSSQRFYLAQTLIKHKKHNQNRGKIIYLLNNNKDKYWVDSQQALFFKSLKLGVDNFNDAHMKDKNWSTNRAS